MSKMIKKTLLVCPPLTHPSIKHNHTPNSDFYRSPPLNVLYLVSATSGHDVDVVDLNVDPHWNLKNIKDKIKDYDLVGLPCLTPTFRSVLEICQIAKKCGIQTLVGGYHPTLLPSILEDYDCIDMIIRGEGEVAFKELLDNKIKSEILGLSYKENGKVINNHDRPFVEDMDDLPFPANDAVHSKLYNILGIQMWACETTRGCPFKCKFCCVSAFNKATYRKKSPERVIEELKRVPDGTKMIFFTDDNFTLIKSRVMRICDLMQEEGLHKKYNFMCQARVEDIANNPDMIQKMAESGFGVVFLGIESFNQKSLDQMDKETSVEKTKKTVDLCHENGIFVEGSFIVGNIGETKEDVKNNLKIAMELGIDLMMGTIITAYPGTPLYDEVISKGWMEKDFKWEEWDGMLFPSMRTDKLTKDELLSLVEFYYKKFYGITRLPFFIKRVFNGLVYPQYKFDIKSQLTALINLTKAYMIPDLKKRIADLTSLFKF